MTNREGPAWSQLVFYYNPDCLAGLSLSYYDSLIFKSLELSFDSSCRQAGDSRQLFRQALVLKRHRNSGMLLKIRTAETPSLEFIPVGIPRPLSTTVIESPG